MSGVQWYETRRIFQRNPALMSTAKLLDDELRDNVQNPEHVYTFDRTDFGRVTWDMTYKKFHPVTPTYVLSDRLSAKPPMREGLLIAASNIAIPEISDDAIPAYMANGIDMPSIDERDPGFEAFGGDRHPTEVYFVEGALSGLIKIGIASDVEKRFASLRTDSAEPLSMIHHLPANGHLEKFLHGLFEPLRHHGEWFYPHWTIYSVIIGLRG